MKKQQGTSNTPIQLVIYDLDGTLLDAFSDIAESLNAALRECGLRTYDVETVKGFVGFGVEVFLDRAVRPEDEAHRERIREMFEARYANPDTKYLRLYDAVPETLAHVRKQGIAQAILTNKPQAVTDRVCELMGLTNLVERIEGARADRPLKPDPTAALELLHEFDIPPERAVIVGDGKADLGAARAAGIPVIGVTWGTLTRAELVPFAPAAIIDSMRELPAILGNNRLGRSGGL